MLPHIIVVGNLIDGLRFIGPFGDSDDAIRYGETNCGGDWVDRSTNKGRHHRAG